MPSNTKSTLRKLEKLFSEQDYSIRYEKGNFNSGYCVVESKKVVVVNKFFDLTGRIEVLLDILSRIIVFDELMSLDSKKFYRSILKEQEASII